MQETYRLLRECLWFLEAQDDPEYSPHTLAQQKMKLEEQIDRQLAALEADNLWSSQGDEAFFLPRLPAGWAAQVQEPSRSFRFTARGPEQNGHRILVLAIDPETLVDTVTLYHRIVGAIRERERESA